MAKEKFERTKPHVNIGTIGHVEGREKPAPKPAAGKKPKRRRGRDEEVTARRR